MRPRLFVFLRLLHYLERRSQGKRSPLHVLLPGHLWLYFLLKVRWFYTSHHWFSSPTFCRRFQVLLWTISVYRRLLIGVWYHPHILYQLKTNRAVWSEGSRLLSSFITNSRNMLNSVGDSRQPWRTPIFTANQSVICPFITTAHSVSSYRISIILTIFGSTPIAIIIFQRAFLQTVSNAALKSTKLKWRGTLCSLAFSMTCLAMKMASTVPRPCLKPNWLSFIDASVLAFILFSNIWLKTFPGIDSKDIAR